MKKGSLKTFTRNTLIKVMFDIILATVEKHPIFTRQSEVLVLVPGDDEHKTYFLPL